MAKKIRIHVANETSKAIGRRIKDLRTTKSISQKQLGKLANLSQNHISNIENGIENISDDAISRIAGALETSFQYLKEGNIVALKKTEKKKKQQESKNNMCEGQMSFADLGWICG